MSWRAIGRVFLRTCACSLEASKRTFSRMSVSWGLAVVKRQSILVYWRTLRRSQIGALWLCYGLRPGKGGREGLWWRAAFQVVNGILTKRWEAGLTSRSKLCMGFIAAQFWKVLIRSVLGLLHSRVLYRSVTDVLCHLHLWSHLSK